MYWSPMSPALRPNPSNRLTIISWWEYTVSAPSTGTIRLYGPSSNIFCLCTTFTQTNILVGTGGQAHVAALGAVFVPSTVPGVDADRFFAAPPRNWMAGEGGIR